MNALPLVLEVIGLAQPAGSKRAVTWRSKDGRSGTNVIDANPKAKPWQNTVAQTAASVWTGPLLDEPLILYVTFQIPRPAGHFGKRGLRPGAPEFPAVRPDLLKLTRAVEDALTGVLWRDDALIVYEMLTKRYGEPAKLTVCVDRPPDLAARLFAATGGLEPEATIERER